jgi:homopolymeric O-antigen transport system permease protein
MLHSALVGATDLRAAWAYRDLLRHLVLRDLRHKYKGSSLGFAWSLLHPLLMAAVYTVAFRLIVRVNIAHFPLFLLSGLLPWMFFTAALSGASGAIVDNGTLVRKVAFPRVILPLAAVATQLVQFALMYLIIVPLLFAFGIGLRPALVALLPVIALQVVFTAGLGLLFATAYVYARDTRHLLDVGLQVWFWVTPVVYSAALVPDSIASILRWNPMARFITSYHDIIVDGRAPTLATFGLLVVCAGLAGAVGLLVFDRHQRRFAERV